MKKTVLFLGAGTSKAFHYPLTSEILPQIVRKIVVGSLFNNSYGRKEEKDLYRFLIKEFLISLSPGLRDAFKNPKLIEKEGIPLITDLLSQAEHLASNCNDILDYNFETKHQMLGKINSINERWQLRDLINLLDWAIINVINQGNDDKENLNEFINWIKKSNKSTSKHISIISSNYDYSIEYNLLTWSQIDHTHKLIDYGFNYRDVEDGKLCYRPQKPLYTIFKLHGSTDWLNCKRCGFIYINTCVDIYDLAFRNVKVDANTCHCGYWPLNPVLVTPSIIRTSEEKSLHQIWTSSLESLRTADEWIIIGYSLPMEDLDIKSLFLRAMKGRTKLPKIKIIQQTGRSKGRFENFFGTKNIEFHIGGVEKYQF